MHSTILNNPIIFGLSIEVYFILAIICILTFFFWRWLLRKYIKAERPRKILTWSATIISTPIIYLGLILIFIFGISYTPNKDFDKSLWLTDQEGRYQMAGNIINSRMLIGKDTTQVKQVLGEPTFFGDTTKVWTYDMGCGGGGLGFLFHYLTLKLDNDGKVTYVEHQKIRD